MIFKWFVICSASIIGGQALIALYYAYGIFDLWIDYICKLAK